MNGDLKFLFNFEFLYYIKNNAIKFTFYKRLNIFNKYIKKIF